MTLNPTTKKFDVLNSCAMEQCSSQPLLWDRGHPVVASNNPPFDIGPARTLFRKMALYSAVLGVDADRRETWAKMVDQLASFPTTIDPTSGKVVSVHNCLQPPPVISPRAACKCHPSSRV
jgi:hypothetical protein